MWVILISGRDSGYSISGSTYYVALEAALRFVAEKLGIVDQSIIDVISWEEAGII